MGKVVYYEFWRKWEDGFDKQKTDRYKNRFLGLLLFFFPFISLLLFLRLSHSLFLSFIIALCCTVCYYIDGPSLPLVRFRLTGPENPV